MKSVDVIIYINKKNTHLAISDSDGNIKVIDMSLGYGNSYAPSTVLYNLENEEFVFLNSVNDYDIDEDVVVFDSILDFLDKEHIEHRNINVETSHFFENFFKQLLENIKSFDSDVFIDKIKICYQNITDNRSKVIVSSLNMLGYKNISFITQKNALYNLVDLEDSIDVLFFDYSQILLNNIVKNIDDSYKETITNFDFSLEELENIFVSKFLECCDEGTYIDVFNIKKAFNENFSLIVSKYIKNEDISIYLNFCFPPIVVNFTKEALDEIFNDMFFRIRIDAKKIYVYSEFDLLGIIKKNISADIEIKSINIIEGIAKDNKIVINNTESMKYDYCFLIKNNNITEFIPVIRKDDTILTRFKEHYFYHLKKYGEDIVLYKKIDDSTYNKIKSINIKKLNIKSDISMIKFKVVVDNNKFMFEFVNYGFLNKNMVLGKMLVSIDEV